MAEEKQKKGVAREVKWRRSEDSEKGQGKRRDKEDGGRLGGGG